MTTKFNLKNPAIRRILGELKELQKTPSTDFTASPVDDNLFDWHFTIRGPQDTEFSQGKYHGRITLPPEYPFKPPSIIMLTPNGRFEVGKKICLTITGFHEEHWQPAWGIRTALMALVSFFPTKSEGAIAGIDWSPDERRVLAQRSGVWKCPKCDCDNDSLLPDTLSVDTNESGDQSSSIPVSPVKSDQQVDLTMFKLSYETSKGQNNSLSVNTGNNNSEKAQKVEDDDDIPLAQSPVRKPPSFPASTSDIMPKSATGSIDSQLIRKRNLSSSSTTSPTRAKPRTLSTSSTASNQSGSMSTGARVSHSHTQWFLDLLIVIVVISIIFLLIRQLVLLQNGR